MRASPAECYRRCGSAARALAIASLLLAAACSGGAASTEAEDASVPVDLAPPPDLAHTNAIVRARPYASLAPAAWSAADPRPLVVLLHGYGVNGAAQNSYFGLYRLIEDERFFYAFPDGTKDERGLAYWNADGSPDAKYADDVAYLDALLDDMAARFPVDPKRVYLVGHSNGAFMAYHYACVRAGRVAAIVTLAGGGWVMPTCAPAAEVSVLALHGDADETIPYGGGEILDRPFPSAHDSIAVWAKNNGCKEAPDTAGAPVDLLTGPMAETTTERYVPCRAGAVELWTMRGGGHIPGLTKGFAGTIYSFLKERRRP